MQLTRNIVTTRTEDGTLYWNGVNWSSSIDESFLFFEADEAEVAIENGDVRLEGERGPFVVRTVTVKWTLEPLQR